MTIHIKGRKAAARPQMANGRRGEITASQPASEMKTKPPKFWAEI
jgi:hypothetical protein